jgi:TonB family protein
LPKSQWAPRAREHLALLKKRADTTTKRRLAPAPAGEVEGRDTTVSDRRAIRRRMRARLRALHRCYRRTRRGDKDKHLVGSMRVSFVVSAAGKPSDVTLLSSTVSRPALHACVLDVIRKTTFPRMSIRRSLKVVYPIDFKSR